MLIFVNMTFAWGFGWIVAWSRRTFFSVDCFTKVSLCVGVALVSLLLFCLYCHFVMYSFLLSHWYCWLSLADQFLVVLWPFIYNYCFFTIRRVIVINVFDHCISQIILEIVAIFGLMIFCFVRANIFVCRHSCDIHILLAVCSRIVFIKLIKLCFSVFIIICMTWSVCILLFMSVNTIFVTLLLPC